MAGLKSIQIPSRLRAKHKGFEELGEWSEQVVRTLKQIRDQAAADLAVRDDFNYKPEFGPRGFVLDGATWKTEIRIGRVLSIFPAATPAPLDQLQAYIGTTSLEAATPPKLSLAGLASYNYVHVKTNNHGKPIEQGVASGIYATVVSSATEKNTTHFELPNGAGGSGVEGLYYWPIFQTESDGGSPTARPRMVKNWGMRGNIEWVRGYNALENIGDCDLYDDYDISSDTKQLKGIKAGFGIALDDTSGLDCKVYFDATTIGSGAPVFNPSAKAGDSDKAEFVSLGEPGQIDVTADGAGTINIRGNSNDNDYRFQDCNTNEIVTLTFTDGVATGPGGTVSVPDCPS